MPSPPRSVFSKGLFASLEEPGSWQAPGAAASVRGTYCPFTLSSLPVGGVHSCRTSAFPDQQSCLVTLLGLPGRRICLSFWLRLSQQAGEDLAGFVWLTGLDAGSISSQLNICVSLASPGHSGSANKCSSCPDIHKGWLLWFYRLHSGRPEYCSTHKSCGGVKLSDKLL